MGAEGMWLSDVLWTGFVHTNTNVEITVVCTEMFPMWSQHSIMWS